MVPNDFNGGFVIENLSDGTYWSGSEWVSRLSQAKHYPPAPEDGIVQANAERSRLASLGHRCYVFFSPHSVQEGPAGQST